ncbi:MAG: integrase core domain-containing protein [Phycisphaerales bacterium]
MAQDSQGRSYAERLQQTIQQECLEKFLVVGTRHLDYLVREYITHYNTERPHSGIDFRVPMSGNAPEARAGPVVAGLIRRHERLGGVIKHYTRTAA